MGGGYSIPKDKHIVVVGGGYGGVLFSLELKKAGANFTLISANDSLFHNVGSVRSLIQPGWAEKTFIPLEPAFGESFIHDRVVNVQPDSKKVICKSGQEVPYDILVMATGSTGPFPFKVEENCKDKSIPCYEPWMKRVKDSQRIAVIGGGATGVEQAAEIMTYYTDKQVTLFHSSEKLICPGMPDKFYTRLDQIMDNLKVKVIRGEKVKDLDNISGVDVKPPITVTTDKGTSIEVDLVIKCIGLSVNSDAYSKAFGDVMEKNGQLKVNELLQVDGQPDVFAIGDCNNCADMKLAYSAKLQCEWLLANLDKIVKGNTVKPYQPNSSPIKMILAVGPKNALVVSKWGFMLPEMIGISAKSKDLFVAMYWGALGQPMPRHPSEDDKKGWSVTSVVFIGAILLGVAYAAQPLYRSLLGDSM